MKREIFEDVYVVDNMKTSLNIVMNAKDMMSKCYVVNNLETLKESLDSHNVNALRIFLDNWQLDCIIMASFYENFWKAELISKGFIVHRVNETFEPLYNIQLKRPISIEEIKAVLRSSNNLTMLAEKTIPIHLSEKSYYKRFSTISLSIRKAMKLINYERNKLHFKNEMIVTWSKNLIWSIEEFRKFYIDITEYIEKEYKPTRHFTSTHVPD